MADTIYSLTEAQLQKILAAISAQQQGWWPVVSVFVSALLAMIVGILLERYRGWRDRIKSTRERQEREIQQINAVISGLAFNIERLFHIASQNILPHYRDSYLVHERLNTNIEDSAHIYEIIRSLPKYPCLFETCPEICLIEYDFSKVLPFVIERDAEIVKYSGWLVAGVHEIKETTARRNRYIEKVIDGGFQQAADNLHYFIITIRGQVAIAKAECVVASQLFEVLIRLATSLVAINDGYKIPAKKSRFTLPDTLPETMKELKEISEKIPIRS